MYNRDDGMEFCASTILTLVVIVRSPVVPRGEGGAVVSYDTRKVVAGVFQTELHRAWPRCFGRLL